MKVLRSFCAGFASGAVIYVGASVFLLGIAMLTNTATKTFDAIVK